MRHSGASSGKRAGATPTAPHRLKEMPGRQGVRFVRIVTVAAVAALAVGLTALASPPPLAAQDELVDSASVLEELKELQRDFETYREARTPVRRDTRDGSCDERIGRICIWFGGDEEERFPAELREVGLARGQLIRSLRDGFDRIRDRWVLGQLVHYMVEQDAMEDAQRTALDCGLDETWWCRALHGYVLHMWTRYVDAENAFRDALDQMPDSTWFEWTTPRWILPPDAVDAFNELAPAERDAAFELYWTLSDPLFLMEGNDRLTDHFARLVIAENRRDAADPMGMTWEPDLEETLVRYGRNLGYSRTHDPDRLMRSGQLTDTRNMVGHHHPRSRGYLFPHDYLASPADIPPESWITAPREARTWYAPPYAPDMRGLETQVGRFRRDDRMLVVGAYRPTLPEDGGESEVVSAWGEGGVTATPHAALFLIPVDGSPPEYVRGDEPEGVLTLEAWPGRYVAGLEVVNVQDRQAWRARQGVVQEPLTPGLVGVSDLVILREGAPLPESLDEALPHVRPGVRLRAGERFPVVWEVYGLRIEEPVRVTIGFSEGRPGFLERVGEFLGVIEPDRSVDITFDDAGPDRVQAIFRSIELELPDLEPGEYTLHLRLELTGRTPVVTSRPIIVEEG